MMMRFVYVFIFKSYVVDQFLEILRKINKLLFSVISFVKENHLILSCNEVNWSIRTRVHSLSDGSKN